MTRLLTGNRIITMRGTGPRSRSFRCRTAAAATAFIGDDPERDVLEAAAVGMLTVWLLHWRTRPGGPTGPHHTLDGLNTLEAILLDINYASNERSR